MRVNTNHSTIFKIGMSEVEKVEQFTYLKSIITKNGGSEQNVPIEFVRPSRHSKCSAPFETLNSSTLKRNYISTILT